MGAFSFLVAWYNIPFLVSLVCCLLFALLQLFAGGGDNDADGDADLDADVDADLDAHLDADLDAHLDAVAAHSDTEGTGPFGTALSALGVGRVPLMLILIALLGCFGFLGLLFNSLLINLPGGYPALAFIPVVLGGGLAALLLTGRISSLLARLAPNNSAAVSFEQLVGRSGVVVSSTVSHSYGRVAVRDSFGTVHTVFAVIANGEPLPEKSEVALLSYDTTGRHFIVKPLRPVSRTTLPR